MSGIAITNAEILQAERIKDRNQLTKPSNGALGTYSGPNPSSGKRLESFTATRYWRISALVDGLEQLAEKVLWSSF
jgi:hypothetical protein